MPHALAHEWPAGGWVGQLRDAAPKLLRYRLRHDPPARLTCAGNANDGCLIPSADWPWTNDVINAWHAVKALPAPT